MADFPNGSNIPTQPGPNNNAGTMSGIWQALQTMNQVWGLINQTLQKVFPQVIGTSTTATGGAATLPANPVGFLDVTNPATGATVKIPYYT